MIAAKADCTGIVSLNIGLFLLGISLSGLCTWRTAIELNLVNAFEPLQPFRGTSSLQAVKLRSGENHSLTANSSCIEMGSGLQIVMHIAN